MRASLLIVAAGVILMGCATRNPAPQDPFDHVVYKVEHEVVPSYPFVPIDLPATASPEQLISALSVRGDFQYRHISRFSISEVRAVDISSRQHTAALLDTNRGQMFVLLHYDGDGYGWYFKIYEAK
jgi:hypothetical protein